jgi:hypothetical protein
LGCTACPAVLRLSWLSSAQGPLDKAALFVSVGSAGLPVCVGIGCIADVHPAIAVPGEARTAVAPTGGRNPGRDPGGDRPAPSPTAADAPASPSGPPAETQTRTRDPDTQTRTGEPDTADPDTATEAHNPCGSRIHKTGRQDKPGSHNA